MKILELKEVNLGINEIDFSPRKLFCLKKCLKNEISRRNVVARKMNAFKENIAETTQCSDCEAENVALKHFLKTILQWNRHLGTYIEKGWNKELVSYCSSCENKHSSRSNIFNPSLQPFPNF